MASGFFPFTKQTQTIKGTEQQPMVPIPQYPAFNEFRVAKLKLPSPPGNT
jgi:hypothetical protein